MPNIIKVRCNGPDKHINDVDLEKAHGTTVVVRGIPTTESTIPERVVLPCQFCTVGKVIITREMFEENL
ncbi:MAG: hypothetical protein GY845_30805 [Planctomycetes bacterium]|nr:hypothetical protein [Planctomycetota bacterium]